MNNFDNIFLYIFTSVPKSSSRTDSLILCIDLFVRPNSTTWSHTLAINRPSEVPPLVLIWVFIFVISSIESLHTLMNSWLVVRYGSPECFQLISYFTLLFLSILMILSLISSWFVSVEYLILNEILISPGITSVSYTHLRAHET